MAGLSNRHPALAAVFSVLLLSLGGIPPTAGFVAKWYIFSAAVRSGDYLLAIIGVLTSVVSIFFYLRVIVMMYMAEPADLPRSPEPSRAATFTLAVSVIVTFYLGILPTRVPRPRGAVDREPVLGSHGTRASDLRHRVRPLPRARS